MGKQGFEMAAQVRTADDILWTKFLLLLPNYYTHEEITTPMTALIEKWATIDVKSFSKQNLRLLKQANEHTIFKV